MFPRHTLAAAWLFTVENGTSQKDYDERFFQAERNSTEKRGKKVFCCIQYCFELILLLRDRKDVEYFDLFSRTVVFDGLSLLKSHQMLKKGGLAAAPHHLEEVLCCSIEVLLIFSDSFVVLAIRSM